VDPVKILLNDLRRCPKLSRVEINALNEKRLEGDAEARRQLIECCLPWAVKYAGRFSCGKVDYAELVSLAIEGLIAAVDRFDHDKGSLTAIVAWMVRKSILKYLRVDRWAIRLPYYIMAKQTKPLSRRRQRCLDCAKRVMEGIRSLDDVRDRMHHDSLFENSQPWESCLEYEDNPLDTLIAQEDGDVQDARCELINSLPDRGREVITRRMRGETLTSIAPSLGISKERVRQIEAQALKQLRRLAQEANLVGQEQ